MYTKVEPQDENNSSEFKPTGPIRPHKIEKQLELNKLVKNRDYYCTCNVHNKQGN